MDDVIAGSETDQAGRILERIERSIAAGNKILYYPLVVKEAHGSTITDVAGKDYLDFNASWTVASLGYSHPEVVRAIEEEIREALGLSQSTFPGETSIKFAEKLLELTGTNGSKRKVWFGHSGGEACAAAYKLFPRATKRARVVSFYGSYHGMDLADLAMSGHPALTSYEVPSLVTKVPFANCYRCPFGLEYPSCGIYCASDFIEDQAFKYVCPPEQVSFMITEPIQSDAGDIVPPQGYLEKLSSTCEKYGILFVVDEVKVGLGRSGKMLATDHASNIVPDAVALGKSLASGVPVGALVANSDLLDSGFASSTLTGNRIAAAAGLATLEIIQKDKLHERAALLGDYMMKKLVELEEKHELIGDVRGRGLIIGVELVKNRKSKDPASIETAKVVFRAWQLGLLLAFVSADSNVIEITPPLVITFEEIDRGIELLDRALSDVEKGIVPDSAVEKYTGF